MQVILYRNEHCNFSRSVMFMLINFLELRILEFKGNYIQTYCVPLMPRLMAVIIFFYFQAREPLTVNGFLRIGQRVIKQRVMN